MLGTRRWAMRRNLMVALAALWLVPVLALGQEGKYAPKRGAEVFVYPEKLTSKDKLTDGTHGKAIEIKSDAMLVWVDLAPDARFSHGTEYILISAEVTRVVKGGWWPVLNGKDLFRDGRQAKVEFPIVIPRQGKDAPEVFVYPEKLTSQTRLTDGKANHFAHKSIEIKSETTLIWVDPLPTALFSHCTEYILISAEGTRVTKGDWWPVLEGKDLFRDGKKTTVEFPVFLPRK